MLRGNKASNIKVATHNTRDVCWETDRLYAVMRERKEEMEREGEAVAEKVLRRQEGFG